MRYLNIFICSLIIVISSKSFAAVPGSVGHKQNQQTGKQDFCTKFSDESGTTVNDDCSPIVVPDGMLEQAGRSFRLISGAIQGTTTQLTTTDVDISASFSRVEKSIAHDPAFQSGTLEDGVEGQIITIEIVAVAQAGDTFTLTPDTATGFTSLKFEGVGDFVTLLYVDDDTGWIRLTIETVQSIP